VYDSSLNQIFVERDTCGETKRNMSAKWDECEVGILNISSLLFVFLNISILVVLFTFG